MYHRDRYRLVLFALLLLAAIPGTLRAGDEGMLRLRPNDYSFRASGKPFESLSFKEEEGQQHSPDGMPQSFSLRLRLSLSEFDTDAEVFSIRDVLSVRLRQHDPKNIRRQNYPAGKMPDGRVPVLEAGIRLRLPEGCTPVREGQPSVQEMVVGVPLALLPKPWGRHELVLSFTGVCWDMYVDGALVDRDYALGYPLQKDMLQWQKDAATVLSAELHVPGLVSSLKKEKGKTYVPVQYFTPRGHNAWVGDVATLWHDGRYHIFYLLDRRGHESKFGRGGHYFEHISTADFLDWTEHEAAVPIEEQWETLGTGTPFVWHDSLMLSYGMHTSRVWPSERTATPGQWEYIRSHGESQCIPFAHPFISTEAGIPSGASYSVSADGVAAFSKSHRLIHPAENPTIYTDRDGRLCMLANYGARGMWTSDRLDGGWHCLSEDFPPGGDCTFIFRWGGYDYIVGGFTHMWMKRADEATDAYTDMVAPGEDLYDGLSVPSICELPDGRHLMAGWVEMNRHWGGPLVIRELIQYPDGRLGSRFMPELMPKTKKGVREAGDGTLSPQQSYLLTFDVEPEAEDGRLDLRLSSRETGKECVWTLDHRKRTARFGEGKSLREGGQPQHATDYAIESLRGLEKPFTVKVIMLNNSKFGGTLLDVEIAGQRTMISHREGLDVDCFRFSQQGLTVKNLRVSELESLSAASTGAVKAQRPSSLVPSKPSAAPDYYCTWNLQGYVCSYGAGAGSNDLRLEINEDNLFGQQLGYKVWGHEQSKTTLTSGQPQREVTWTVPARYQGWLGHYPMLRADLTFVMDDSWDIPRGPGPDGASKRPYGRNYDNEHLATMTISPDRFPSFSGNSQQRMKRLVKAVKKQGWRSLGGWVCAQNPIGLTHEYTGMENTYENSLRWTPGQEERFWQLRLRESQRAGFDYWKVDWGNKDRDEQFRRRLSEWGREVAPDVIIEHASFQDGGTHHPDFITFSQTIRSYDVNNQIAQAQTLQRLFDLSQQRDAELAGWGIINCEDEAYIAAGLGCAIGVMRHPYVGALPNGQPDTYFADCGPGSRQLKNRLNEIVRAVRWHRIAQPFGHERSQWKADSETLQESGDGKTWEAPARMSRRLPLPEIEGEAATAPDRPYLLASLYDNECTAVSIINRNINGIYQQKRVHVSVQPLRYDRKVGIFGYCQSLTLRYQGGLPSGSFTVYAQDLASDDAPTAVPYTLTSDGRGIIIQGAVLEALTKGHDYPYSEVVREEGKDYTDLSDPAVVLLVVPEGKNK